MSITPRLHIILDDSVGLGHRARCWAIAEEWLRRKGAVTWGLSGIGTDKVVMLFDGYNTDQQYRDFWREAGHIIVAQDDLGVTERAHVVINHAFDADARMPEYVGRGHMQILMGPKYFPLRSDYAPLKPTTDGKVFDTDLVGRQMQPDEFARRMAAAPYVICSAGITVYEALYLRKPLLVRLAAENQRATYDGVLKRHWAWPDTPENRERISDPVLRQTITISNGRHPVDSSGAKRIVDSALAAYWLGSPHATLAVNR